MKTILKLSFIMFLAAFMVNTAVAQDKSKRASPPMKEEAKIGDANVIVAYSAPSAKGRAIWGQLVPYGKIWRAGANEATTFESDKELTVQGEALKAGKYSIFLVPAENEWTYVFNSVSDQWGAYQYDESKDVLRVVTTPEKNSEKVEQLTYKIEGGKLWLLWDDMKGGVEIK
ncbi:DUF2911 domain-containing protein [Portibacter marinus]|uniref:DUF2911 domain-containing protein n=1 Tax=Portibacter marinus TaxID=2898660 RepID=UPI001F329404|nr:DUF2911 domain-containing protein [Portibacter marinus]